MSLDDLGFDPFDDRLGNQLRAGAPSAPNADRTLGELRPRFTRARQRRRTVLAGAWGLAGAGVLALGLVIIGSGPTNRVDTPPASRPDRDTTTTTAPTTTSTTTSPGTTPDTLDDHGGNRGPGGGDDSGSSGSGSGSSGSGSGSSGSGSGSSGSGSGND